MHLPPTRFPDGDAEAIVVLGSGVYPVNYSTPQALPALRYFLALPTRCLAVSQLEAVAGYRFGSAEASSAKTVIADVMRRTLIDAGVHRMP